jgi:hypothetical protein
MPTRTRWHARSKAAGCSSLVQRIGRRLDRAVHVTMANALALCMPFVVSEGVSVIGYAFTTADVRGYVTWLVGASAFEIWARTAAVSVLRGERFSRALGAVLRRPVLVVYVIVACAEPWLTDFASNLISLPLFFAGSLVVFATMLALVGTVADGVAPVRALAFWLREMCRPRRLAINSTGALIVAFLMVIVPYILGGLPGTDWEPAGYLLAVPYGVGDAFAMVFVVLWHDAALDDRYGRDIEHVLDATPA